MGSGFTNDVMHAENVDFRGVHPVQPQMISDGQLLIGSTASPNIRANHLTAGAGITITNGPGTISIASTSSTTDLHTAKFIVSAEGTVGTGANFTTISAAIAAAQGTGLKSDVFVMPGTYTENITMVAGINLTSFACDGKASTGSAQAPNVKIVGQITGPAANFCTISNIELSNSTGDVIVIGAGILSLINCQILIQGNGNSGITNASGTSVWLYNCLLYTNGTNVKYFTFSANSSINLFNCTTQSGGTVAASTIADGGANIYYSQILYPITSSGTAQLDLRHSSFGFTALNATYLTAGGTGTTNSALNCEFLSGTGSAISISVGVTFLMSNCSINSTNANVITGAGELNYSNLSFNNTSSTVNTTTQTPRVSSNDAIKVVSPGAYPYTTVPQDGIILVDTSVARTIVPLASPTTGQRHIIKDSVGSAAANAITITPSGKNIDGIASYTINANYGSATIVYNGTEWSVI